MHYFALAAQGVHTQGLKPLVSVGLYSKIVVPIALYGSKYGQTLQHLTSQSFQDSSTTLQNASKVYRHAPVPT